MSRLVEPMPRRSFLRGLASLPLIGGGVALIGDPVAADVVRDRALQRRYVAWLANEHAAALIEYHQPGIHHIEPWAWRGLRCTDNAPLYWFPDGNDDIEAAVWTTQPSSRAAVVLAAAGCDWRAGT